MLEVNGRVFSHGSMVVFLLFLLHLVNECQAVYTPTLTWSKAHATFYGGSDASGTMGITPSLFVCLLQASLVNGSYSILVDTLSSVVTITN